MPVELPLFVYGTLMPGEVNYPGYLAGRTKDEQPATTAGELWLVQEEDYPYLCQGSDKVSGCLVMLQPEHYRQVLQRIDLLEDFDPRQPEQSLYLRRQIRVVSSAGELLVWSYLWNRPERPGIRLADGNFANRNR